MNEKRSSRIRQFSRTLLAVTMLGHFSLAQSSAPVSYASTEQLNQLLTRLDLASQATQADLAKVRVEKWKADSGTKRDAESSIDSLARNLKDALPAITANLRKSPEDLGTTFELYRNLDALYDVFRSVTESTGAFGSKDDFQSLQNDLENLEAVRRGFADRMESLASSKQKEVDNLRAELQKTQTHPAGTTDVPKKTVVDDTAPPAKKTVKKKPKPAPSTGSTTTSPPPQQ
jgi:hypothetical protein